MFTKKNSSGNLKIDRKLSIINAKKSSSKKTGSTFRNNLNKSASESKIINSHHQYHHQTHSDVQIIQSSRNQGK